MKKDKSTGAKTNSCKTPRRTRKDAAIPEKGSGNQQQLERNEICDFENHASAPIRKETLSPTSKARREISRNEFMEKSWVPDRVQGLKKSIVVRIVREPGMGLLNSSKLD